LSAGTNFALWLLVIEFLDEFIYGAREAAWPLIRADLTLTYAQVGLLLGLPGLASSVVEPVLGILGDIWKRRILVVGGGLFFALSLLLSGISRSYGWLLISFLLFNPASGAFVNLSQATLMDAAPRRREQNMARWSFAGSLGVVLGPVALALFVLLGLGWRGAFVTTALVTVCLLPVVWRFSFAPPARSDDGPRSGLVSGLRAALRALGRGPVMRWLLLLQASDLMLDILLGFLALYFVDVVGVSTARASTAVAIWTAVGLVGDFLLIPLLTRVSGLRYLRISAGAELLLFVTFLVTRTFPIKLVLLALLGFLNAGWYAILKAQLYASMPGRSGTAMAVSNLFGMVGALIPWALGLVAQRWGLPAAMWCLVVGPLALLVGLPGASSGTPGLRTKIN
jgi:FSR family fosmidomycin resistance protein-like MFS transporter